MDILRHIITGCDQLSATAAPLLNSMGLHMVLSLATIMMVWFGVQEALASAHGGPGFHMGKFLNFFMLITFAYIMVRYYDTTILGLSFSLRSLIRDGSNGIVSTIGADTTNNMLDSIDGILMQAGPGMAIFTAPYALIVYVAVQIMLPVLSTLTAPILPYAPL